MPLAVSLSFNCFVSFTPNKERALPARVNTKKNGVFCTFVWTVLEQVMNVLVFCLLILAQIIHSLDASAFAENAILGAKA